MDQDNGMEGHYIFLCFMPWTALQLVLLQTDNFVATNCCECNLVYFCALRLNLFQLFGLRP